MVRAVLNKIFLQKLGIWRFVFSGIAFLVGLTLASLAFQAYIRIGEYLSPAKGRSNYVIINKEVVLAHTLLGGRAQFQQDEVSDLRRQPFVDELAAFRSNNYEVVAHAGGEMGLYTELFFESIPSRFIDNVPGSFHWEEGSDVVPIIISQDFLDLYNFGFALGKGSRQLSRSTIQLVPFDIQISGPHGRRAFKGKVSGFTERIPSVLVPEEFLRWTNEHIGDTAAQSTSRIIIKVKANGSGDLEKYLKEHNLIVANEKMKFGKLLSGVNIFMAAVLVIGVGFIIFSLVIVVLNFSLIVSQSHEEVSLLLQLGYSRKQLTFHLTRYLMLFLLAVAVLSGIAWWVGNGALVSLLSDSGITIVPAPANATMMLAAGFVFVFLIISSTTIRRLINRQQP